MKHNLGSRAAFALIGLLTLALAAGAARLPAPFSAVVKTPTQHDRWYWEKTGQVVWEASADRPFVALTFDDGPDPAGTPRVLEILAAYGARATFFQIGSKVRQHPQLARQVAEAGHEIGNHTLSHAYLWGATELRIRREIEGAREAIEDVAGVGTTLFRPPGGSYTDPIVRTAERLGYTVVLWSWTEDPRDWTTTSAEVIKKRVLDSAAPGKIIVLHDGGGDRTQMLRALPEIVAGLIDKGLRLVTVSELLRR